MQSISPTRYNVLLASNSPRRRELLHMIVPNFGIAQAANVEETYPSNLAPEKVPEYLSQIKAKPYASLINQNELIITADTVVINDGKILGKPKDFDDAAEMLKALRNKTHTVVTGVTLTTIDSLETFSCSTDVTFGDISDVEIELYINEFRPFDKAGAYGIQEWIGCIGIQGINGCFYNVMGLPLYSLYQRLKKYA